MTRQILIALCTVVVLAGCTEKKYYDSPTEASPTVSASASFDWAYLNQNQVTCLGQGCGVQFFDRSTNARRWQWTFGDGGTSGLKDPIHFYREDNCGRNSNCTMIVNLQVCPEADLRFDDGRCSTAQGVVFIPPPT